MALRSDFHDMPWPFRYDQITPTSGRRNAMDTRKTLPYTRLAQMPNRKKPLAEPVRYAMNAAMPTPMKPEMAGWIGSLRTTRITAIRAALPSEPQIETARLWKTVLSRTNTSTGTDE